jgi:hypothetical protein
MPELDTLSRAVALRKQLKCQFRLALFYWVLGLISIRRNVNVTGTEE